jgi:transcriptional regulator with XRE-family HTH domain
MSRIIEGKEMNLIGDRLRVLRKKHHLSQQQLSERLETQAVYICRGSISRIEDKSRTVTDIELMGLAKVLGVKIQDLFE